jgi:hypothetical protein
VVTRVNDAGRRLEAQATGQDPFGGTKHRGYGREHAIQTLQEFGSTKMIRFPSGTGTIPTWRGVTDIFGTASPAPGRAEDARAGHRDA